MFVACNIYLFFFFFIISILIFHLNALPRKSANQRASFAPDDSNTFKPSQVIGNPPAPTTKPTMASLKSSPLSSLAQIHKEPTRFQIRSAEIDSILQHLKQNAPPHPLCPPRPKHFVAVTL